LILWTIFRRVFGQNGLCSLKNTPWTDLRMNGVQEVGGSNPHQGASSRPDYMGDSNK